ncbi:MAG TPA: FtsX-like permease family protein, partial [Vicinamibacterales bacterium]|nr:FtsX-like permease family protein [Vicinamibacterales bacterium]
FNRSWLRQRELQPRLAPPDEALPRALVSGLRPGGGPDPSLTARTALWVGGVSMLVLMIATANAANLWVGRALARRRETALRLACGIGRGRLVSQLMTESLVVAGTSAAAGLCLAYWGSAVMFRLLTTATGPVAGMIDDRVLLATVAVTVIAAILTSIGPSLFAHRVPVAASLRTGPRGTTEGMRLRTALAIAQASLSVMLIVGAILFVRSFMAAKAAPLGYEPDRVLTVNRTYRGAPLPAAERAELRRRLLEAAKAHPAVEAASWRFTTPFGTSAQARFTVDGIDAVDRLGPFTTQEASADYFKVMGTRIVKGRAFNRDDRPDTPRVVVVSQTMADVLWPGQDPIGQCMRFTGPRAGTCATVVGVAEDVVLTRLTANDKHFYLSLDQSGGDGTGMFLRVRGEPADHAESIRRALQPLMPGTSYVTVQPLETLVARGHQSWRTGAFLFVTFGALALAVAAIGLYGVLNYGISQRLPEVGVRLALGARRADILWLVLRPSVGLALGGIAAGTALTIGASRWIEPLLFQQSATAPSAYVLAGAVLCSAALAAALVPAARALRTDPCVVLKGD